jgi:cell division protein FtsZ
MEVATKGIADMQDKVDTLIVVPNQKLFEVVEKNISFFEAMKRVDDILASAVKSISVLITQPGLINVDFADVKSIMANAGTSLMGIGTASGEDRAANATKAAISSPLLEISINGAKGVLLNVVGGKDLAMYEIDEAAKIIGAVVDEDCNVIFGANIDPEMGDDIKITVLATGFDNTQPRHNYLPAEPVTTILTQKSYTPVTSNPKTKSTDEDIEMPKAKAKIVEEEPDTELEPVEDDDSEAEEKDYETPSFMRRKKDY